MIDFSPYLNLPCLITLLIGIAIGLVLDRALPFSLRSKKTENLQTEIMKAYAKQRRITICTKSGTIWRKALVDHMNGSMVAIIYKMKRVNIHSPEVYVTELNIHDIAWIK